MIGVKTVSMFLFPIIAFFVAQLFGKSTTDLLIFTAIGAVIGIMGPRLILSVLSGVSTLPFGEARRIPSICWLCAAKREWAWRARWNE